MLLDGCVEQRFSRSDFIFGRTTTTSSNRCELCEQATTMGDVRRPTAHMGQPPTDLLTAAGAVVKSTSHFILFFCRKGCSSFKWSPVNAPPPHHHCDIHIGYRRKLRVEIRIVLTAQAHPQLVLRHLLHRLIPES